MQHFIEKEKQTLLPVNIYKYNALFNFLPYPPPPFRISNHQPCSVYSKVVHIDREPTVLAMMFRLLIHVYMWTLEKLIQYRSQVIRRVTLKANRVHLAMLCFIHVIVWTSSIICNRHYHWFFWTEVVHPELRYLCLLYRCMFKCLYWRMLLTYWIYVFFK